MIKDCYRKTLPYQLAKKAFYSTKNFWYYAHRKPLLNKLKNTIIRLFEDPNDEKNLNIDEISIISLNCFAGRIMQDVGIVYNSPTLGLYFMYPDYIEFLRNIKFYLKEAKIEFVEHSKYPLGDERRAKWSHWYPIGLLGGKVEIHFLHYHTEEEAADKWYRRAARVKWDKILIIGMDQNLCTEKDIYDFDALPHKQKIMFSNRKIPLESNEYMPEFASLESVGDAYKYGHIYYKHLINHFK